jgi:DtxR family Mn-dependent transcriptional regulator
MTPNKEDYLKCIYELGQLDQKITNKLIAEKMAFSAPAVSEMLKKMVAEELISKDVKAGYLLSQTALEMVSSLYRKHRLIEVFLVEQLGYSPEEVHEEAEILEHTVSDHFINRLDLLLEQPQTCPHGGSIPQAGQPHGIL